MQVDGIIWSIILDKIIFISIPILHTNITDFSMHDSSPLGGTHHRIANISLELPWKIKEEMVFINSEQIRPQLEV